jgi:hypothetical protein
VIDSDDLSFRGYQSRQAIQIDAMIFRQIADAKTCMFLDGELLPGDEIRVMLESRDDDLVALAEIGAPVGRRNEVYPFGCTPRENQAVAIAQSHEFCDTFSSRIVSIGCLDRQRIRAAVRIRVRVLVEIPDCIQHDTWLLRCRCRIEIMKIRPIEKNRKISAAVHHDTPGPTKMLSPSIRTS